MQETQSLVNAVIAEKLQQVSQVLTENNLDPDILLAEVLENDSHSNIFQNLHNQRAQKGPFTYYVVGLGGGGGQTKYFKILRGEGGGPGI